MIFQPRNIDGDDDGGDDDICNEALIIILHILIYYQDVHTRYSGRIQNILGVVVWTIRTTSKKVSCIKHHVQFSCGFALIVDGENLNRSSNFSVCYTVGLLL